MSMHDFGPCQFAAKATWKGDVRLRVFSPSEGDVAVLLLGPKQCRELAYELLREADGAEEIIAKARDQGTEGQSSGSEATAQPQPPAKGATP